MEFDFDSMNLGDLFAAADAIGDKYLSVEAIAARKSELAALEDEMFDVLDPEFYLAPEDQ